MSSYSLLANLIVDGFVTGCIYAMVAIGFSLTWWVSNVVHLAHGGVLIAAGLALYLFVGVFGVPLPLGVVGALAVAVLLGLGTHRLIYQPLKDRRTEEMGMLTASLGALIVIEYTLVMAFGLDGATLDAGDMRMPLAPKVVLVLDAFAVATVATTALVFIALIWFMHRTVHGKRMQAVAQNSDLAQVLGIDIPGVARQAAVVSAALVVPAAGFMLYSTGVRPIDALHIVLVAAIVAIIGGRGSIVGALVAGILVGIAESATVWYLAAGWRLLVTFVILYAVLLFRPQGLFGKT
ncbi:branched-chain amino acid ABC transporter permease [Mesorhizobium sp. YR577]|uniref:branched-chain amino acid ABC transporter permease n=1 Tax=Mesorhizobium sp. YR577 TaxID=1884373 RepID=UPI0008ED2AA9|nr:branched-chain amino acid ABC transporter permease [Mesorhizobium sp. YR577]SFU21807.1 amino acid/amide ABC transporter membrane protein 1, HAAT family [Mesorhizobium sp. YR577]